MKVFFAAATLLLLLPIAGSSQDCTFHQLPGLPSSVSVKGNNGLIQYSGVVSNYLEIEQKIVSHSTKCGLPYSIAHLHSWEKIQRKISKHLNSRVIKPTGYKLLYDGNTIYIKVRSKNVQIALERSIDKISATIALPAHLILKSVYVAPSDDVQQLLHNSIILNSPIVALISPSGVIHRPGDILIDGWKITDINSSFALIISGKTRLYINLNTRPKSTFDRLSAELFSHR